MYLDDDPELKSYLESNGLDFDEVSDIIIKYKAPSPSSPLIPSASIHSVICKEIDHYLAIKREIDSFPGELRGKILQYARDTAHIGVEPKKIRQQLRNELMSIQQARADIDATVQTMDRIRKQEAQRGGTKLKMESIRSGDLEVMLAQFIDSVDIELQRQCDIAIHSKDQRLSSKLFAILDSRRCAEIGVRTLMDLFYGVHQSTRPRDGDNGRETTANGIVYGVPFSIICQSIGKEIERDLFLRNKLSSKDTMRFLGEDSPFAASEQSADRDRLQRAKHLGIRLGDSFQVRDLYQIGAAVMESMLTSCTVGGTAKLRAFSHHVDASNPRKVIGMVSCHETVGRMLQSEMRYKPPSEIHPVAQPMVIPPRRWSNIEFSLVDIPFLCLLFVLIL